MLAQSFDYDAAWKRVTELEAKNLPRSAWDAVKLIYQHAKKDRQEGQQIKSLIHQLKYREQVEDSAQQQNFAALEAEIKAADAPARQILESMLAELYWDYLRQNRYKLYNRTTVQNNPGDDISTWDAAQLNRAIAVHYQASLVPAGQLQKTAIDTLPELIEKGEHTAALRPTLYDLLAQRALDYFRNDENGITRPADVFSLSDPAAFAPAREFAHTDFNTTDTAAPAYRALLLFGQLIAVHLDDSRPDALIDADIQRLQFAWEKSVSPDKDSLYEHALQQLIQQYPRNATASQAYYLLAQQYYSRAQQYHPLTDTLHRYDALKAKALAEEAVKTFPHSEGGISCAALLREIQRPQITLQSEKVNVPDKPFRTLVEYRNIKTAFFRVVKADADGPEAQTDSGYWNKILHQPVLKQWQVSLPDTRDYQEHAAEIKVEGLPPGSYLLLAADEAGFSRETATLALSVSDLSYTGDNKGNYWVLHRETGKPLKDVQVKAWVSRYDNKARKNIKSLQGKYVTDANGHFRVTRKEKDYAGIMLELTLGKDHLSSDNYQYIPYNVSGNTPEKKRKPRLFLFTDRSIYRPGQTVYFKGLVTQQPAPGGSWHTVENYKGSIYLYDANHQVVDSLPVTTNAYGSYAGQFKLPEGSLNGNFSLQDDSLGGTQYFSVEEYKRPKFYVELQPPSSAYRLNDSVRVQGKAVSYAGASVMNGTVKYRVVRRARIIPLGFRSYLPIRPLPQQEIAQGEATTDAEGNFSVPFVMRPDENVPREQQPVFHYLVYADVTDISGETRSGTADLAAGYQSLVLELDIPEKLSSDSLQRIRIHSMSVSDTFRPAEVQLSVKQLEAPDRELRNRYWQQPDQFVISESEYHRDFPYDVYRDEDDPARWVVLKEVLSKRDSSHADGHFLDRAAGQQLPSGWYAVTATAEDKDGNTVKAIRYVQVYGSKDRKPSGPAVFWHTLSSGEAAPGDKVELLLGSAGDGYVLLRQKSGRQPKEDQQLVSLRNEIKRISVPVNESDRGGILLSYLMVKHNRIYSGDTLIRVPWTNKQLQLSWSTFRDKTLPGEQEKWRLKIAGPGGQQATAELLAAMYDASLDVFRSHNWATPATLYPTLAEGNAWHTDNNFNAVRSRDYYRPDTAVQDSYEKTYAQLNWFGYPHSRRIGIMLRGQAAGVMAKSDASPAPAQEVVVVGYGAQEKKAITGSVAMPAPAPPPAMQVRKNLQETAFFFPQLHADAEGSISLEFTMPEALTRWRLMMLAHTPDLAYGYAEKEVITQKKLMVTPNLPRFLRNGDEISIAARIDNLSEATLSGKARLQLLDAETLEPVGRLFGQDSVQSFSVEAGRSSAVRFALKIPEDFHSALTCRITADAGTYSDGEENVLPVLSNRMLVTETLPLNMPEAGTKHFRMDKLLQSGASSTLQSYSLTAEFTTNPAWYAVQALPYLAEYPHSCAEQLFNRYYAVSVGRHIAQTQPNIEKVFDTWRKDTSALRSNLQKNEDLKSVLLDASPWVRDAKNEAERKQQLAGFFDTVRLQAQSTQTLEQLQQLQTPNGGFSWFGGMQDDRYITQYILSGIGHLQQLGIPQQSSIIRGITTRALPYLDQRIREDYQRILQDKTKKDDDHLSNLAIQYLYMRSFFPSIPVGDSARTAYNYFMAQAQQHWTRQSIYMQGMIALVLHRSGSEKTATDIIRSLKETATYSPEMGMYWKKMKGGFYWYEAPVETQALLIEAFAEIARDTRTVDRLKTWLLKQKQTRNWPSTKSTADACYALLLQGSNWPEQQPEVRLALGKETVDSRNEKTEAGTGYFQKKFPATAVRPEMGDITVQLESGSAAGPAWGAVYWQYFENLDKITGAATSLSIQKALYRQENTAKGPVLVPLKDNEVLHVGDRIVSRMVLRTDRDLEYVHLKDMRASCFEPLQVLSGYQWKEGAGYYSETKDASMNFFFDHLPKGTHVLEYPMVVGSAGDFSNGISTVQCMYAPEFAAHAGGQRVRVEERK
ncbi:alpha-2-macroglobulin family protein [Compostibacter hankyongensis]|uniref:Alpha-2-macroglobulin family protein n=2 Tax=Compostibacter hankyongensis TaxID=1007089 RepID=A0ABP8FIB9_9BACT